MRKSVFKGLLVALLLIFTLSVAHTAETLTLLHVNDFHGRVFPYLDKAIDGDKSVSGAAYLAEMIKAERAKNPGGVILLSAGDMFQGTPVSNLYNGRPVLEFMNLARFDAMTLGNHEFDWGRDVLADMVRDAAFPVVSANIIDKNGRRLPGVKPYVMLERKGLKIAVIGFTTPDTTYMTNSKYLSDLIFEQPESILPALVKEVKDGGAHIVVLLTHLGFDADKRLASKVRGTDVIVGGHSHTAVVDPVRVGKTLVVQAGYNGTYLGVLELSVEEKTGSILTAAERGELKVVFAGRDDKFDTDVARMADGYGEKTKGKFQEVVGEAAVDLVRRADGESNIGNAIADAMRESAGADVSFQNNGGIRADVPKGKITVEQVYTILPFDNVLVSMTLKGADLRELFEMSSSLGKGMLQVSGAKVVYDLKMPVGKRVVEVRIGGTVLDVSKPYRIVTNDFLASGGDRFSPFGRGRDVIYGGELRDVFLEYVRRHSPLAPKREGRIVVRGT